MTAEPCRLVISRFVQLLNSSDPRLAVEIISPSAVFHVPGEDHAFMGPPGCLDVLDILRAGFPDMRWSLHDLVGADDRAAARLCLRGTHTGNFLDVPATGTALVMDHIGFYRIAGG